MAARQFSDLEKLTYIETLIEIGRKLPGTHGVEDRDGVAMLSQIARDLRARIDSAPSVTITQLERRMAARIGAHGQDYYGACVGVSEELVGRWPVVKQALQRFGVEVEKEQR